MKAIIEVGVNLAQDSFDMVKGHEDCVYYGFEPTYDLINDLNNKFNDHKNMVLIPMAVDIENRVANFNIAGWHNMGCSSLHNFSDDIKQTWPENPAYFNKSQNVMTIRLDDFCKLYNITEIEKLWIDAQGSDFNVLKSLGDYIEIVKWGRLEVAYNVKLYKDVDNSYDSVIKYLKDYGFKTETKFDNTPQKCEADITFYK